MGANLRENIKRGSSDLRTIFLTDIENLETLSHPNIAKILGKGEYKHRIFIVQRYYDAGSLEYHLQEVDFMEAAEKVIEGVSYLHQQGLVHRDIKPSNVFLTGDKYLVVIGDLQTCRRPEELVMTTDDDGRIRGHGFTHGTTHSAPEVLVEHRAEQSADVYSLGLVLWKMLTGRKLPFSYSTEFFEGLEKDKHRETHEENVRRMIGDLPEGTGEELRSVIRRCLDFDPNKRYANASLMLEEFRKAKRVSGQQYGSIERAD
ncbi:serine/threonine protein kinase [archaeon]|nr:serine/threonine protein kinase [archaeon]